MRMPFQRTPDPNGLVLGRTGRYRFMPRVTVSEKVRRFHTYVVGLTGRGKSKFLQNCLLQDIRAGRGCAVVDPHGDLAKDVLRSLLASGYFGDESAYERIIYIAPRRRDFAVPFNVLQRSGADMETYEVAQRVIAAFMRTWARALAEPPRFQQIMRASLAVLVETNATLCDLYRLLTDDAFRTEQLARVSDPKVAADCRAFFHNEYDQWGRDQRMMIASTTNKVSALTDNPSLFYMLGQAENRLQVREIMDAGKVLLVDLGDCDEETKRLFGTLIVTGFEQAALSRARAPYAVRKPFYLYVDEFQDFACHPGAAETFSQMLSQVRKFGLHMVLANQSIAQLDQRLQTALGNAQTIVAFRISRADAEALSRVLGEVDVREVKHDNQGSHHPLFSPVHEQWEEFVQFLTRQPVRQAVIKTADDRLAVVWSEFVNEGSTSPDKLEAVLIRLLKQVGRPLEEVSRELVKVPEEEWDEIFS